MQLEYVLTLPKSPTFIFDDNEMTFSINQIKSRLTSVMYFKVRFYDMHDTLIHTYTQSDRWVIPTEYTSRSHTFTIPSNVQDDIVASQVELRFVNIDSENPVYFNELMLNVGEYEEYHSPNYLNKGLSVRLNNNCYANLYGDNGSYLQVIRPYGEDFTTDKITRHKCTVLAPHLAEEDSIDDPSNIVYEFIKQTEQVIEVLK